MRLEVSGWPRTPNIGLRGDANTRGLHPSGLEERRVNQERDLEGLDSKKHIVRLAHQLGEKKRLALVEKIKRLNVRIANPGPIEAAKPIPAGETAEKSETAATVTEESMTPETGSTNKEDKPEGTIEPEAASTESGEGEE